jgi:formylglycine-generating enzyme required for sulfatase activity
MKLLFIFAALLLALPAHAQVNMDWVTVGDPGNACETQSQGCFGAVAYTYQIGRYEVTNAQYAEFLNAVAATDTYSLYTTSMGSGVGGITRSGSSGSYTYSTIADRENMPVNYVSFYDSLRFANWLHNGQPSGAQDSATTEDGAYTFSDATSVGARNEGATIFLTSEDEWYKAAYYDAGSASYFDYPTGSDTQTTCAVPGTTVNTANCGYVVTDLTDRGSYTGSASPSGSFDQGGNLWEWNEAIFESNRSFRGGSYFFSFSGDLAASHRDGNDPSSEYNDIGFRVASIAAPEAVPSLSRMGVALTGGLVFGIGIVGLTLAARRERG